MDLQQQLRICFTERDKQKQRDSILHICSLVKKDAVASDLLTGACQEQLRVVSCSTAFLECLRFFLFNNGIQELLSKVDSLMSCHCSIVRFVKSW